MRSAATAMSDAGVTTGEIGALIALVEQDSLTAAELQSRTLLARHPGIGMLWKILSVALLRQGKGALLALRKAAQLLPQDAETHGNLAAALQDQGQWAEALPCWRRVLELQPRNPAALTGAAAALSGLGCALRDRGERRRAAAAFSQAVELDPARAEHHLNLGNALLDLSRTEAAIDCYRQALALQPDHAAAHVSLSVALRLRRRAAEAEASCQAALTVNPRYVEGLTMLGELRADRGRFAEALELFERAIEIDATQPAAYCSIAAHRRMLPTDEAWLDGTTALLSKPLPLRDAISVHYALGKYHDDVGRYAEAFDHYRQANDLSRRPEPARDGAQLSQRVDAVIAGCGAPFLGRAAVRASAGAGASASVSELPVFIVGMPRSGTSLVEQILASHPAVVGAGELKFWDDAFGKFDADRSAQSVQRLAGEYLSRLPPRVDGVARVVDKMPANFLYAGLIHAVFPRARIIHMRRHPVDTCLSMYFQNFSGMGAYANDLGDLAHYYGEYVRITDHWRAVLPTSALLEVPYEALVADQESWTRRMLEFIGLPWDPACMEFQDTERVVITASKWQVRQKIHSASVGRRRHYEPWTGPLVQALEQAGVRLR